LIGRTRDDERDAPRCEQGGEDGYCLHGGAVYHADEVGHERTNTLTAVLQ
jgi:hypothetical protein